MVAAIIYESNTGFTKKYAKLLGKELGLKAYTIKEAESILKLQSPVVFLGWICAGKITGYEKAARSYHISAVCGVGLRQPGEDAARKISLDNRLGNIPFFYLQGGYDKQKLGLVYKMMMGMMEKGLEHKQHLTEEELYMKRMIKEGADNVSIEQLNPIIRYLKTKVE